MTEETRGIKLVQVSDPANEPQPHSVPPIEPKSTREVEREGWGRRILYSLLTGAVIVVMLIVATLVFRAFFSDPPVHVTDADPPFDRPLCPGDQLVINSRVVVDKPVVLFFYVSVMDGTASKNENDTQISFPGRIHPQPTTFYQLLPWTVPELPPGKYTRALAVRGTDGDENPVILLKPFEIGSSNICKVPLSYRKDGIQWTRFLAYLSYLLLPRL